MPRPRNPANESGRAAQERYKAKLDETGGATTDAVDAAISAAVAIFRYEAETRGQDKNLERIEGIERMATAILVSKGGKPKPVLHAVHLRTRRLDVEELQRLASQPLGDGRPGPAADLYHMTRP